jgi:putative Ca2+/H+ antiporter (TMEM165/GDT1 family)
LILASAIGVLAGGSVAVLFPEKILKGLAALMALRLLWPGMEEQSRLVSMKTTNQFCCC